MLPLHLLLPTIKGIPVLMYHRVWEATNDRLTISPERLEEHLSYLKNSGYKALSLFDFLSIAKGEKPYLERSFLLTFDDGCVNNLTFAYPIIKELGMTATFFIIGNCLIGDKQNIDEPINQKMNVEQLTQLDESVVQLALHSHNHIHFGKSEIQVIQSDLTENINAFAKSGLPFFKVLAYPFGGRMKDEKDKRVLTKWMQSIGIEAAFRIGNKPCKMPANNLFELKRIDVWGTDTIVQLAIKLKKGKLKPF